MPVKTLGSPKNRNRQLLAWRQAVNELADQVQAWAAQEQWSVVRQEKRIHESRYGSYSLPFLRISTPQGELQLDPIGLDIVGAEGRVDFQTWPTMNRFLFLRKGNEWRVREDNGNLLRRTWNRKTFLQLAADLALAL